VGSIRQVLRFVERKGRLPYCRVPPIVGSWSQCRTEGPTVITIGRGDYQPGRVLFLNGGASAGKTTLGRSLQSVLSDPWLLLGIDLLIWTLPPEMINDPEGLSVREGVITRGLLFMSLYSGYQMAVAALARSGVNGLLDDLTLDGSDDQQRWNDALHGLDVIWVGVRCAPEIAAERAAGRGSRLPGTARHQAESVHEGVRYDFEVDTGVLDQGDSMSPIAEWLERRWSIPSSPPSNQQSPLPPISAWTPGGASHPPPWER
jgi:chloramphenicol 3-O phosphotransferase